MNEKEKGKPSNLKECGPDATASHDIRLPVIGRSRHLSMAPPSGKPHTTAHRNADQFPKELMTK